MKYLILVSHGGLAEGLKTSLALFAGDKMNQVIAVGLKEGKSVDLKIKQKSPCIRLVLDLVKI